MAYFFEQGTYVFRGSYTEAGPVTPLPIEGGFTVTGDSQLLTVEGTWQQHSGRPKSPFKIEIDSKDLVGFLGRVVATLGSSQLAGWVSVSAEGICALVRDNAGNCASLQTHRIKSKAHTAQGMLISGKIGGISFDLMIGPFEPEVAMENVVSLAGRKEK